MPRKLLPVSLAVLLFVLSACNMVRVEDGTISIDINVPESMINSLVTRANDTTNQRSSEDILFDQVTRVELIEPDIIRVHGEAEVDGVMESGSYDVRIGAASGALSLAITAVNMEGVDLDDPRLVTANAELREAFTDQIRTSFGTGPISDARIEGGALILEIDAPLN